jgi:hypothetical protein
MKLRLTASQLSLWVGQKMNPDTPMYNTAASYDIAGAIDVDVFRRAFQLLINSTDALRIQFTEEDGIPYQAVREPFRYEPEIIDFSHSPGDADVFDWLVARSRQKLDLADRVFDAALLKITDKRYIWFLNMHHLVTDAVSRRIIFNRMAKLYAGLKVDETLRIENPAFLDYVTSQLELENAQTDSQNYWTDRIRDLGKTPLFYGVRQAGKATETTRVSLRLGPERSGKLKALAQRPDLRSWTEHLALFNILSGLLFVYMYRISGEKKLAMGTPLHNRVSKKYNETVGYFLEIFPLVTEINDQDTFNTLLQRVKLETNENLKHALQSTVSQEISRSFNVVLNYIHTSFPDFNGLKTTSNWVFPQHMDSGHQMRCHVVDFEGTGEIELLFDFNHETFNQALRQRAPQHFLILMDAMLSNPDTPLDQPSISTGEEKHIAVGKSQLRFTYSSFYELFATSVAAHPGAVALRFGQGTISYGALNEMADVLAAHLSELGIRAGHRIALYNYRSPEYIICVWAAVKLGATFVPIASDQPVERISYILGNADCSLVLTNSLL